MKTTKTRTLAEARDLLSRGQRAEAIALLEAHRIDPACAVRLRELYLGEHDNARARDVARQLAVAGDDEAHVSRSVLALMDRDLDTAVRECEQALSLSPDLATAWNQLGRALHNADQALQANSALRRAVELDPGYAEAWYNLAFVQRASGALTEAVRAFRRALELAPGYRAAERNLGISLLMAERPDEALYCLQSVLSRDPDDVEALVNAGFVLHTLGRFGESRSYLERATALDAGDPTAWTYLGALLHETNEPEAAMDALQRAVALDPGDVEAWVEMASIHEQANRLTEAREALERADRAQPGHPALRLEWSRLLRREGDLEASLASLRALDPAGLPPKLAQQFQFELGKLLDRKGEWELAYEAFAAGNRLKARNPRRRDIDPQGFIRRCREVGDWLVAGAPGGQAQAGDPTDDTGADLCFLVGFPRSGTTLLDTMLDAHPAVASIEEAPTLEVVIEELRRLPAGYPGALAQLDGVRLDKLRELYRDRCRLLLGEERPGRILDKLPLRFLHVGLIRRLFPDARILFSLRHPCDVVLSNFMQAYADNEAFIHFDTLGDSAATYQLAMGVWLQIEETLCPPVVFTRYEDLVADPQAELARVCGHLGLTPVAAMFDEVERMAQRAPVRTTSYQQVAERVYQRSVGRWLHYRRHFEPYLDQLAPFIDRFGYAIAVNPTADVNPGPGLD